MFEVPNHKKSAKQDRFEFSIDGAAFSVKRLKFVPMGERATFNDGGNALEFFSGTTKKQHDAIHGLIEDEWDALVAAWQQDSDVTLGESEASAS
jgi:hypothetical protein